MINIRIRIWISFIAFIAISSLIYFISYYNYIAIDKTFLRRIWYNYDILESYCKKNECKYSTSSVFTIYTMQYFLYLSCNLFVIVKVIFYNNNKVIRNALIFFIIISVSIVNYIYFFDKFDFQIKSLYSNSVSTSTISYLRISIITSIFIFCLNPLYWVTTSNNRKA